MNANIEIILNQIVEKLKINYNPIKIILFGSYAYGNASEDSDIDLFIVKSTTKRRVDSFLEVKRLIYNPNLKIPISPLVYIPLELENRIKISDDFIEEILQKGEILYEKAVS